MKRTFSLSTITMLLMLMFASLAYANSVGVTYSQIIDDRSLGITGDYTAEIGKRVTFESDVKIQGGDIYNVDIDTDFIFDIATVDLKLLVSNKLKGYTLNTLGRSQSVGLAFTVPVDSMNFDVGVGGKNASPFSAPNAFDTLTAAGFAESDLVDKNLDALTPKATGIPFKNGSTVNAFVTTGFTAGIFDVDVKGVVELLGEGDKMHQVNLNFKTDGKVGGVLITTAIEVGLASYQDLIHREIATVMTAGIDF